MCTKTKKHQKQVIKEKNKRQNISGVAELDERMQ